jgi:peptide chain release factor 2
LYKKTEDLLALAELAAEAEDPDSAKEAEAGLAVAEKTYQRLELEAMFSGEYDDHSALVSINAGAGGTESCDWVDMLSRMYMRWAENKGFKVEVMDRVPGDQAGSKSVTISLEGLYAFGYLKSEQGVHRLVRISPFDSSARRHTSFASVDVLPQVEAAEEVKIPADELRIDNYHASSAGGQHMQKNETAVRITHIPSGIVVQCENERSQGRNKDSAMKVLQSRLLQLHRQEQEAKLAGLRGEQREIAWGSQIRSYVLHPYSLVKDNRTNLEIGNASGVLDGDLDPFLEAFLRQQLSNK